MKTIDEILNKRPRCVAIHADNSPEWLLVDQWATEHLLVIVPIPHFFTPSQITNMALKAGVDCVFCDNPAEFFWAALGYQKVGRFGHLSVMISEDIHAVSLAKNTHKITFTSGSTAQAKGVCLSLSHLNTVGQSLVLATEHLNLKRHLSVLPYSVLLENMAAVYANTFANGGRGLDIISLPLEQVGLQGSGCFNPAKLVQCLIEHQADSLILMPMMLKSLLQYLTDNPADLSHVKFMAVGGAVCPPALIARAHQMGLPVYQGYGISECGSVICLNTTFSHENSVGQPLSHVQLSLDQRQQIIYRGPGFLGYLGDTQSHQNSQTELVYATGDTGEFDANQNLIIRGRLNNLIVTGYGRNVSPEWIEAELLAIESISQVMVVGDGQAFLTALCVTHLQEKACYKQIQTINQRLPDYARVNAIVKVSPFSISEGTLTATGKLKRTEIIKKYQSQLEKIYDDEPTHAYS